MNQASSAFSYPIGVRALLPDEARRHRAIDSTIVNSLEAEGFEEIVLPMIDFVDAYADAFDRDLQRTSYRFIDRGGDLVSIRSDFTPMVARALAPALNRLTLPLRVFYRGDVIRCEATRLGSSREFYQVGAELIGDPSQEADFAMLELAIGIVASLGVNPTVSINDTSLVSNLVRSCDVTPEREGAIRAALASKQTAALDALMPDSTGAGLLRDLVRGRVTLEQLESFPETAVAASRLSQLMERAGRLPDTNLLLSLDDVDEHPGYYTGLRFRLFHGRTRTAIAQGGRYDSLYRRFGTDASAVGFTVTVDDLEIPNGGVPGYASTGETR